MDGIIYATLAASLVTVPEKLRDVRAVLLNCLDPERDLPAVLPDDRLGGQQAVEHLLASGLTGPVHVVGEDPSPEATAGRDRMAGITAALAEAGMSLAGVVSCPWGVRPAYDAVDAWLRTGARPGALICLNDRIAMGVYQALAEHGLAVPGDVAVISFDGSEMASWLRPRVTSLGLPFRAMGTLAVETLMSSGRRRPAGIVATAAGAAAGRVGVTFAIDGQFVWDFWTAYDEAHGVHHLFHLYAPTSLGDPELRHRNARVGHAVSADLRTWTRLPDPLPPRSAGSGGVRRPGVLDGLRRAR